MSNQIEYFVVDDKKNVVKIKEYLKSQGVREEFSQFIRYEVMDEKQEGESNYLDISERLGFSWEQNAKIGLMNYDYRARWMMDRVRDYAFELVHDIGFPIYEVSGSNMFDMSHPVVDSYAKLYGDRLFQLEVGGENSVMSYDASYPQFNLASRYNIRQENLPFAHFSVSDCYRHEQSGECMLMYRLRRFFMPDLHPYLKDVKQAFKWYPRIENQLIKAARAVGREYELVVEVGSKHFWSEYRDEICGLVEKFGKEILVAVHMDEKPRYWIVNADYKIIDKLGHSREICCIQIDIGNAKRLGIKYWDNEGQERNPVIIHSAVPGGIERYLYMVIDGLPEHFPLWLNPCQLRIIPVSDRFLPQVDHALESLSHYNCRIEVDDRSESVSKRVKLAKDDMVEKSLVVGQKEIDSGLAEYIAAYAKDIHEKNKSIPFQDISWPRDLSRQLIRV